MKKQLLFNFFFVLSIFYLSAQTKSETAKTTDNLKKTQQYAFSEKLYLQTDKDYYSAADTLFFKGYLVTAATLQPAISQYIYVELIDETLEIVSRLKFKKQKQGFEGQIALSPQQPAGKYQLRAYSWWMQNEGIPYFFTKPIIIGNNLSIEAKSVIQYTHTSDKKTIATLKITDRNNDPVSGFWVNATKPVSTTQNRTERRKTNDQGEVMFTIDTQKELGENPILKIWGENNLHNLSNSFVIPVKIENKADVEMLFFPESGHLLPDVMQTIAFKANGRDGFGIPITGDILNQQGDTIISFSTSHCGMGKFTIQPNRYETYMAHIKTIDGIQAAYALPKATPNIIIQTSQRKGVLTCAIENQTALPNDSVYITLHQHGICYLHQQVSKINNGILRINTSSIPDGIAILSATDSKHTVLCERLIFISSVNRPQLTAKGDKESYPAREKGILTFSVADSQGKALQGNFSLALTDEKLVQKNEESPTIESALLLTSDLKGFIENPAQYFDYTDIFRTHKLDLLMLTQGWRKYDISLILKDTTTTPQYYLEMGESIEGKVTNLRGKPAVKVPVHLISTTQNTVFLSTHTNEKGRFLFEGFNLPDSSLFILKSSTPKKALNFLTIEVEKQQFPPRLKLPPTHSTEKNSTFDEYLFSAKERMYTEDGMRVVALQEINVTGKAIDKDAPGDAAFAERSYDRKSLSVFENLNLYTFLQTMPRIGNKIRNMENMQMSDSVTESVLFIVDDFKNHLEYIKDMPMSDIAAIYLYTDPSSTMAYDPSGVPVVVIQLKKGAERQSTGLHPSIAIAAPLGYTLPVQFYQPNYAVDSVRTQNKPDFRTTILWQPQLDLDEKGMANAIFFTADKSNNYRYVIEGITNTGIPCRIEGIIDRKQ